MCIWPLAIFSQISHGWWLVKFTLFFFFYLLYTLLLLVCDAASGRAMRERAAVIVTRATIVVSSTRRASFTSVARGDYHVLYSLFSLIRKFALSFLSISKIKNF